MPFYISVINFLLIIILTPFLNYGQENFLVFPSPITQTEPVISINPINPKLIAVSGKTINTATSFTSEGVYVSIDGGLTWTGFDTCIGQLIENHGGDPQIIVDRNGRLILTHIGNPQLFVGIYSHYSNDLGSAWTPAFTISSDQPEDKGSSAIDNSITSAYYSRLYTTWVDQTIPSNPVSFSFSTNSGESWVAPQLINSNAIERSSGGFVKTSRDGKVYSCWAGMSAIAPFNEDSVGFALSSDGGNSWTAKKIIYNVNGIFGTLPSKNGIRINGLPQIAVDNSNGPRSGWIYIITTEINNPPAGSDPDIILHYSSNGGSSWSPGIRVNQDPLNDGKIQYFPAMDVDSTGGINILFYDDRNTASDSAEVWLAKSIDGGTTWKEQVVSDHRFEPKPIAGGASNYQGDHIALTSSGNKLYALWMDDFSGVYQIWLKILDLNILAVKDNAPSPVSFELKQNFPNPFNPETNITFSIPQRSFTSLKIYDLLGKEKAVLVDCEMDYGTHTIKFTPSKSFPSGVYIYRLQCGGYYSSKKLILIK
jgi:Secretion system C-terminal sorting domain